MAPKTSKWMATVASATISVMVGGAAFAAPASAFEGTGTTMGLFPDPISESLASGRTTAAEAQRQARQVNNPQHSTDGTSDVVSDVHGLRTNVAEAQRQARQVNNPQHSTDGTSDVISKALGKVLSSVGTKVAQVKGQARGALNEAS